MKKIKITIVLLLVISFSYTGIAQISLTKKTVLEKQVTIKAPKGFKELDVTEINQKYERGRRPNVVFSNDNGEVSLTLDLKPTQINQEALVKYQANYGFMFSKYRIDQTKNSNDLITINGHIVGFFKLKMPTRTGISYILMFYTNIGNQMLTGMFTCPIDDQEKMGRYNR